MPGPTPKPSALRQRRNRSSTSASLPSAEESASNEVPELPAMFDDEGAPVFWHDMVREWWESVWRSPMAGEFLDSDMRGGLYELAVLRQEFWSATSRSARVAIASEIRLQDVRFGLDTISRRRLQWEVERGEQAAEKTSSRRTRKTAAKPASDPRALLKAI